MIELFLQTSANSIGLLEKNSDEHQIPLLIVSTYYYSACDTTNSACNSP